MTARVKIAVATFAALTILSGAGILVHGTTSVTRQDGQGVTSPTTPRTVVMAAPPAEPLCAELLARCAPIPPAPLDVSVPDSEGALDEVAAEYAAAWAEIEAGL
ncbi:hypothetical protein [Mycobacteroides abscessus]|uniref:hypothetical protein n=1 Tax=Mycobacteroides abscessus TaxID=36809 RepID=UPI000C259574|nr:hypothetical protein [Mycobacteroides abscessus]